MAVPTALPQLGILPGVCDQSYTVSFTVVNTGGGMSEPENYVITDQNGAALDQGTILLGAGENILITATGSPGLVTFTLIAALQTSSISCPLPTETPPSP